jgi:Polysaccharide deacetylase
MQPRTASHSRSLRRSDTGSVCTPGLCVLTFHRVVHACEKDHDVSWTSFLTLLNDLSEAAPRIVASLDPGQAARRGVVLTFDDGTEDHGQVGAELERRGMRGIFFVPACKLGFPGYLSDETLADLHSAGHVIGSHAFTHAPLDRLSEAALSDEIRMSAERLSGVTRTEVVYFAPPGGIDNPFLSHQLARQGFVASRSTTWGLYRSQNERWRVPGIPVTEFTIARSWIRRILRDWQLPLGMRATWAGKQLLPGRVHRSLRSSLHGVR